MALPGRAIATAVTLCVLLATPGLGAPADGPDDRNLVIEVGAWWLAPRNADIDYAFAGVGSLASGGEVRTLGHDRVAVPVLYAGWNLSTSRPTRLGMRFWEYDDRSEAATGVEPQEIGPLLASPTLLASFNFFGFLTADSATADSRLRATLVEGGAQWRHDLSDRGTLRFDAGVRLFRFRRAAQILYREEESQIKELFINQSTESRGIGPRAAVAYAHRFGRAEVGALFGLALMTGELEASSREEFIVDGSLDIATAVNQPGSTQAFLQLDGELRCTIALGRGWSVAAAYAFQQWSDVERSYRFVAAGTATAVPIDGDAVFEGLSLAIRGEF